MKFLGVLLRVIADSKGLCRLLGRVRIGGRDYKRQLAS